MSEKGFSVTDVVRYFKEKKRENIIEVIQKTLPSANIEEVSDWIIEENWGKIGEVLSDYIDLNELLIYKCKSCNEILVVRVLSSIFNSQTSKASIKFLTLRHMNKCRKHDIEVNVPFLPLDLSKEQDISLNESAKKHNKPYDEVLQRSIYNSAKQLTKDELNEFANDDDIRLMELVAHREHLPLFWETF